MSFTFLSFLFTIVISAVIDNTLNLKIIDHYAEKQKLFKFPNGIIF